MNFGAAEIKKAIPATNFETVVRRIRFINRQGDVREITACCCARTELLAVKTETDVTIFYSPGRGFISWLA